MMGIFYTFAAIVSIALLLLGRHYVDKLTRTSAGLSVVIWSMIGYNVLLVLHFLGVITI